MKSSKSPSLLWLIGILALLADQMTKHWARVHFSMPDGFPDYMKSVSVLGDWIQLRLVYNMGAAFGMKPQGVLPFLNPTVFYALFSLIAMIFLGVYYRRLAAHETGSRIGIILIFAGALGNLDDRLRFHRVTDFIDVGIPGVFPRWPTFNVADSCVCVGMGMLILLPLFIKKSHTTLSPVAHDSSSDVG